MTLPMSLADDAAVSLIAVGDGRGYGAFIHLLRQIGFDNLDLGLLRGGEIGTASARVLQRSNPGAASPSWS